MSWSDTSQRGLINVSKNRDIRNYRDMEQKYIDISLFRFTVLCALEIQHEPDSELLEGYFTTVIKTRVSA